MQNEYFTSCFPNISNVASYAFLSQTIHLDRYDRNKFDISIPEHKKVLIHEATHYCDHICTLWGVENIIKIYNAINARIVENENILYHIAILADELKKNSLKTYYKTIAPDAKCYNGAWKMNTSVGLRFNKKGFINKNDPIIFMRFNDESEKLLTRVPLTIQSLFETRAIASELLVELDELRKLHCEGEKIVQYKLMEKQYIELLYDVSRTEYSVAAHFVSIEFNTCDIIETYFQTFLFSTLALNIPKKYFKLLKINKEIETIMQGREKKLIANFDRCFLFYVLVRNAAYNNCPITEKNINTILDYSNLPPWEKIISEIHNEIEFLYKKSLDGPLKSLLTVKYSKSKLWFKNFTFSNISSEFLVNISVLPIIFGDDLNTEKCKYYEQFQEFQKLLNEFMDAC